MEFTLMGVCLALLLGFMPVVAVLLLWWNDIWYSLSVKDGCLATGTKLPPGYMGVPFLGEMLTFLWYFKIRGYPDEYIHSKRRKYGVGIGMYRTHLFGSPAIISFSPSFIKFVHQSKATFVSEWPSMDILGHNSILTAQGTSHTRLRNFVTRAVNQPEALRRIAIMVQPRVAAALRSWAENGRIVTYTETKKVTFQNIGKFLASLEPGRILDNLDELFVGMLKGLRAYPIQFPGSAYQYGLQCRKKAEQFFWEELEKRKKKQEYDSSKIGNDVMDGLMRFKDEEGKQLQDIEIVDNIIGLVLGGYESTSLAIMWAFYYLAKCPKVLQKLQEEHKPFRKNKDGEFITSDEIWKLKYTYQVVEETLRLANISAMMFRKAAKDVQYKGYKIPKGWTVIIWSRYLHTDPDNFQDPLSFNPDRWNEIPKPGTFQVFGGGSRSCAGNMLARLQVAIFIHHLATGYKWELINPNAAVTYLPHPRPVDGVEIAISKL